MPFHVQPVAIRWAVAFFFILSVIGWMAGLDPFTCCKRAMLGAVVAYVVAMAVLRLINGIFIDAMLREKMSQQKGDRIVRGH